MPVQLLSAAYTTLVRGDVLTVDVLVLDADLDVHDVDTLPVVTVTLPAGTTVEPAVSRLGHGTYRATYPTTVTGRHLASVVAGDYGRADLVAMVVTPTSSTDMPTVDDVDAYLTSGSGEHDWSTTDLASALAAEQAAQARTCRLGPVYPADLREALLRRVQRNLAMRPLALAIQRGDGDGGDTNVLPQNDPEVRRLERPYRKLPLG